MLDGPILIRDTEKLTYDVREIMETYILMGEPFTASQVSRDYFIRNEYDFKIADTIPGIIRSTFDSEPVDSVYSTFTKTLVYLESNTSNATKTYLYHPYGISLNNYDICNIAGSPDPSDDAEYVTAIDYSEYVYHAPIGYRKPIRNLLTNIKNLQLKLISHIGYEDFAYDIFETYTSLKHVVDTLVVYQRNLYECKSELSKSTQLPNLKKKLYREFKDNPAYKEFITDLSSLILSDELPLIASIHGYKRKIKVTTERYMSILEIILRNLIRRCDIEKLSYRLVKVYYPNEFSNDVFKVQNISIYPAMATPVFNRISNTEYSFLALKDRKLEAVLLRNHLDTHNIIGCTCSEYKLKSELSHKVCRHIHYLITKYNMTTVA